LRWRVIGTIFVKELRDTLRDRRTLLLMVLLPMALYPALGLGLGQLAAHQIARLKEKTLRVAITGEPLPGLRELLRARKGLTLVDLPAGASVAVLIEKRDLEAAVEVPAGAAASHAQGEVARITLAIDETRDESLEADRRLTRALGDWRKELVQKALAARGLPAGVAEPVRIERRNVASPQRMGASVVARTVPILLLTMIILGAFYPAIDVTAGEKERGTLETLLTSPVGAMEIVTGKYLAVFTVAMIAGAVNLVSLGATFAQGLSLMRTGGGFSVPVDRVALVFATLVPVGLLVSALSLAIAMLAQSFKEAQNLLSPTIMVLVLPAAAAGLPGVELDGFTAFVPGLNVALLTKELLTGDAPVEGMFAVLLANLAYTGLALVFAARNFTSEAVLFGAGEGKRRFLRVSRPGTHAVPTPGQAFFFYCAVFVVWWYAAQVLKRWDLVGGILVGQWGLLLLPTILFALYLRVDLRATFRVRAPSVRGAAAAVLVGGALALVIPGAVAPLQELVLPIPKSFIESMKEFFQVARGDVGDVGWLTLIALTPALCEEPLFRGLLLSGFRSRYSQAMAVLLVAGLFGALHMDLYRFLPTAVAGAALTYLALEAGSIFAASLAHALYNGLLAAAPLVLGEVELSLPVWLVAAGGVTLVAGLWLARGSARVAPLEVQR
jgi:sodium transport system permease protein